MKTSSLKTDRSAWLWGIESGAYSADKAERMIKVLSTRMGLASVPAHLPDPPVPQLSPSRLSGAFCSAWKKRGLIRTDAARYQYACGKSYRDVIRQRNGLITHFPDGVLILQAAEHLCSLYKDAAREGITLIPFGGGTGVVGGTEALTRDNRPILVVDCKRLNQVFEIDEVSRVVRAQAGILGPDLEAALNRKGFSLGHFPQSFEFSTLGGWIVTRSAGQNSTKYGKIEDMVVSLVMATPVGVLATHQVPASATGPSLREMAVGSEGLYGIVTEATVRIHPLPETMIFMAAHFSDFKAGARAVRAVIQSELCPSIVRLSDAVETDLFLKLKSESAVQKLMSYWYAVRSLGQQPCFLMMATEGKKKPAVLEAEAIKAVLRKSGGVLLPNPVSSAMGKAWKGERFRLPYLRDPMMNHGLFIDTPETAATWTKLDTLYSAVKMRFARDKMLSKFLCGCHLSHAYPDGASLYFTFMGVTHPADPLGQWEYMKAAATDALVSAGGAISHHHGIGYDHRRWMHEQHGDTGITVLRGIKHTLDPQGLLNPGKLFEDSL